jgi:1-aminocyclopropane-1-carboxylate deaminase/D-cysteine desulfhydrase-like pyridoxal-dependent ACC family enzyme
MLLYSCCQVTKEEYGRLGGPALGERLAAQLRDERGLNPFIIPVGGSSAMGCWGYLEMSAEVQRQQQELAAAAAAVGAGEAGSGGQGFFTDIAMVG